MNHIIMDMISIPAVEDQDAVLVRVIRSNVCNLLYSTCANSRPGSVHGYEDISIRLLIAFECICRLFCTLVRYIRSAIQPQNTRTRQLSIPKCFQTVGRKHIMTVVNLDRSVTSGNWYFERTNSYWSIFAARLAARKKHLCMDSIK